MPLVINYVHKLQGLDKALPVCLELREQMMARVITILDLEETTRRTELSAFEELIERCSDEVVRIDGGAIPKARSAGGKVRHLIARRRFERQFAEAVSDGATPIMLTIHYGTRRPLGTALARLVKHHGGVRIGYLKSLHDQGRGLSDLHHRAENVTERIRLDPHLDRFLTPDYEPFQRMLEDKGVARSRQIVSGYPLCYATWQDLVRDTEHVRRLNANRRALEVVVFTRGEVRHKPADAQIISDRWVGDAVMQVVREASDIDRDCRVRIKPHPYQDLGVLAEAIAEMPNAEFTDDPPCMLVSAADLAIATYSSAILDAVAFGVPAIEYFEENEAFRRRHPDGSPFGEFGVLIARNAEQFRAGMSAFASGTLGGCDLGAALGSRLNVGDLLR